MFRTARSATVPGVAVLATAVAIALTGCTSDSEATPIQTPTATSTTSDTPTTTPSPTPPSPEGVAADAAQTAVRDFYALADTSLQNAATFNPDDLKQVAISSALIDAQNSLASLAGEGLRQTGTTELTDITMTKVDLEPSDNIPIVEFRVCWDVSGLDVVDKDGTSHVPDTRAPLGVERVGVANYEYPDGPWLVAYLQWLEGETC